MSAERNDRDALAALHEAHGNVGTARENGTPVSRCTCGHRFEGVWDPFDQLDEERQAHLIDAILAAGWVSPEKHAEVVAEWDEAQTKLQRSRSEMGQWRRLANERRHNAEHVRMVEVQRDAAEAEVSRLRAVVERVEALAAEAERRTAMSWSCDINGNRWESPISLADLRSALREGQ